MRLLLDTHILLWAADDAPQLSSLARGLLAGSENELFFSAVSVWEIAVKHALGRSDFPYEPGYLRDALLNQGYKELALTGMHSLQLAALPSLHRDPFDRLLISQALHEGMSFVTSDRLLAQYSKAVILV